MIVRVVEKSVQIIRGNVMSILVMILYIYVKADLHSIYNIANDAGIKKLFFNLTQCIKQRIKALKIFMLLKIFTKLLRKCYRSENIAMGYPKLLLIYDILLCTIGPDHMLPLLSICT